MKRLIAIVVLATYVGGCSVVYSDQPMGDAVRIDPAKWEGVWTSIGETDIDPDVFRIHVVDADNGELLITDGRPEPEPGEMHALVRRHDNWTYLNFWCSDETECSDSLNKDGSIRYVWAVAKISHDVLLVWGPDTRKFAKLVADGELPGDMDGSDVQLHALEPYHYDLIESEEHGTPVDWREPLVLRRNAPVEAPAP